LTIHCLTLSLRYVNMSELVFVLIEGSLNKKL
jgi:hypothetical protein